MQELRIAVLLTTVLIVLTGCGPKYRVDVRFRDGKAAEYTLVSVRDTSLVVQETYERTDKYLAYTHMFILPDSAIDRIEIPVEADFTHSLPLALLGSGLGLTLGKPCDCEDHLSKAVIGFAIGWNLDKLISAYEALTNDWLWLHDEETIRKLRSNAMFPIEPPILGYIKKTYSPD